MVESEEPATGTGGEPAIRLNELAVRYGRVHALGGLTVDVPAGPVGLLGPNGAGKTTLIKVLLGLLVPTSGTARIAGFDPRKRGERVALRARVGYMPESDCLMPGRTGIELVATLGKLTGMRAPDAMTRAHEVLDYVGLDEQRYRPLDEYSTGMKQRLKLAQALVHDPDVLLLDEPTNGLDPKGRRHMLELVHDLGHIQGKNLLLCSHLLPDVEKTCEHVVVLHRGRAIAGGSIAEMTRGEGSELDLATRGDSAAMERELTSRGIAATASAPGTFRVTFEGAAEAGTDAIFAAAARAGCAVESVVPVQSSLEEVFLSALDEASAEEA